MALRSTFDIFMCAILASRVSRREIAYFAFFDPIVDNDYTGTFVLQRRCNMSTPSPRDMTYQAFFQDIADKMRQLGFPPPRDPKPKNWFVTGHELSGVNYALNFGKGIF